MAIPRVLNRKNRILLKELTKTDFKLRYQGSLLGYLWALLRPLMMFAILYFVFSVLLPIGQGDPHYHHVEFLHRMHHARHSSHH